MQDDELSLDWKNWTFTDRNIIHNVHTLQKTCSSVSESSIKSLSLDDLPIVLAPSDSAHGANEEPVDHNSIKQECIKELTSTVYSVDADQETMLHHLLRSAKVVCFILHSSVSFLFSLTRSCQCLLLTLSSPL